MINILSDKTLFDIIVFLQNAEIHDVHEYTGKCFHGCSACEASKILKQIEEEIGILPDKGEKK